MPVSQDAIYDILLGAPKARSELTILQKPDTISDRVRGLKLKLMSYSTLDKKIAYLIKFVTQDLLPQERCTFLQLFKQSIYRDILLSGLGIFSGFVLIRGGLSEKVQKSPKLFKLICVSTGIANLTFGGQTISDAITLLQVINDLQAKYCSKRG